LQQSSTKRINKETVVERLFYGPKKKLASS
jgi:hypothetical protein